MQPVCLSPEFIQSKLLFCVSILSTDSAVSRTLSSASVSFSTDGVYESET